MRFGMGMLTAQNPRGARADADVYAELIELCVLAEEVGYDSVWLSEHHFVDDGYMPSLLVTAAAIAARTERIQIATGVLVAPLHDSVRIAEDAATVDLLSRGRLVLGIGAGYRPEEFAGFGRPMETLGAALDDCVATLKAAWAGNGVVRDGRATVVVTPKPHRPGGPPIWIGARTAAGIRRAGTSADGLLAARVTPEQFGAQVRVFKQAAADAGRDLSSLAAGVHCPVFVADSGAAALLEPYLHYSEWKYSDMMTPYGGRTEVTEVPALDDAMRARLATGGAITGPPDAVAARIVEYADAADEVAFEFIPRLYWPGIPADEQRDLVQRFAEQVIPIVRAANV